MPFPWVLSPTSQPDASRADLPEGPGLTLLNLSCQLLLHIHLVGVALPNGGRSAPACRATFPHRKTTTGIFDWLRTFCVTLPISMPRKPPLPCEPMTTASHCLLCTT